MELEHSISVLMDFEDRDPQKGFNVLTKTALI